MRYAVVIEKGERNTSAYVPDLPGCVSVGDTLEEVKAEIREAIAFHLEGTREDGGPIPPPSSLGGVCRGGGKGRLRGKPGASDATAACDVISGRRRNRLP